MHAVIVKFKNWKMAFQKFGKFEKQSSKFWNIRKIGREQMNEAHKCATITLSAHASHPAPESNSYWIVHTYLSLKEPNTMKNGHRLAAVLGMSLSP